MLCFNGTATSGSYTSLHTLSLHDALPISRVICTLAQGRAVALSAANSGTGERPPETASPARSVAAMLCRRAADISRTMAWMYSWFELNSCRSEEHTSELQSLMRISYAVFCLKNKKSRTQASCTYRE